MTTPWPPAALLAFVQAMPFEHLLRKRLPQEALVRWRVETQAFAHAKPCCVGLLLAVEGDYDQLVQTVSSWRLQTWPGTALVLIGDEADARVQRLRAACPPGSTALVQRTDPATLSALGVDWVVPAAAGDLLHPSLAGTVAQRANAGATAVAWDWLVAGRNGRRVKLLSRRRGPLRDELAEMTEDLRLRAFAVPVAAWHGHPVTDSWNVRMRLAGRDCAVQPHPEPLGIYGPGASSHAADPALAAEHWGAPFEPARDGLHPAHAAAGISVVILYRDRLDLTLNAMRSVLAQQTTGRLEIVLVDNQSTAGTKAAIAEHLRSLPAGVSARVLSYDEPFNHSRQCNLAAQAASEEVLVFMNNDVALLDTHALDRMSRWALIPGIASVGVRVVDAEGRSTGGGFRARRLPGAEFNSPVEEESGAPAERSRITVGNTFACAAVSAAAFRACGGLDEVAFPVGYNDVDFCLRAALQQWRHVNLADVRVSHAVGASRARTDEIAQKLALRGAHAWLATRALREIVDEPVTLPEVFLPPISYDVA